MNKCLVWPIVLLLLSGCATRQAPPDADIIHYYQARTHKDYEDVLAELELAITEHNFRITAHSHVGKVIRERGFSDFPDFDTIQFCNLTRARNLLLLSPEAIRHMPCDVVTYKRDGEVIIKTRLLPTDTDNAELNAFADTINHQLREIVDFAAQE